MILVPIKFPFFRGPFYRPLSHNYNNFISQPYARPDTKPFDHVNTSLQHTPYFMNTHKAEQVQDPDTCETDTNSTSDQTNDRNYKKTSSKFHSVGPILIDTDGFFDKEEPLVQFSGLTLYLDDIIILSLLFILYKEDVKDEILFISLILLLIN